MKKIYFLMITMGLFTLGIQSCKKSSSTPAASKTGNSISFNFNGTAVSGLPASTAGSYSKSKTAFQLESSISKTSAIYLAVDTNFKVGTFELSDDAGINYNPDTNPQHVYFLDTGTVTITSFTSTTITGTFTGTGTDLAGDAGSVTQGKFQVNYTTQP